MLPPGGGVVKYHSKIRKASNWLPQGWPTALRSAISQFCARIYHYSRASISGSVSRRTTKASSNESQESTVPSGEKEHPTPTCSFRESADVAAIHYVRRRAQELEGPMAAD
jgi:hypothetical protein